MEDYAIPVFSVACSVEFPECKMSNLQPVVYEFQQIFKATPGKTNAFYHYISTTGPPVHVPPRRIPTNYWEEILNQLLDQGIIKQSNSPWMAPTVYVRKKIGRNPVVC